MQQHNHYNLIYLLALSIWLDPPFVYPGSHFSFYSPIRLTFSAFEKKFQDIVHFFLFVTHFIYFSMEKELANHNFFSHPLKKIISCQWKQLEASRTKKDLELSAKVAQ